ncbi:VRR-NUC domain-containing protein [Vibrio crassostreae]|uniref:VRR-NUC domain-containing protein n=1 Tax=Vibrio crassostreae TaxID=246167 RepID=UPI001B3043D9|nr:VRR-NUC domain-containing protein [Vibrio crassostreae]
MRLGENTLSALEGLANRAKPKAKTKNKAASPAASTVSPTKTPEKPKKDGELPDWLLEIINSPEIASFKLRTGGISDPCPHEVALYTLHKNHSHYFGKQEYYLQVALFHKTKAKFPEIYEMMFACPNGGMRSRGVAGQMKAEGQKRGYPDIGVDIPTKDFHGLRLEVKTDKGRPHSYQLEWQERLRRHGFMSEVGKGFAECWAIICEYAELVELYKVYREA